MDALRPPVIITLLLRFSTTLSIGLCISPDISYNTQSVFVDHGQTAQKLRDGLFEYGQLPDRLSSSISSCIRYRVCFRAANSKTRNFHFFSGISKSSYPQCAFIRPSSTQQYNTLIRVRTRLIMIKCREIRQFKQCVVRFRYTQANLPDYLCRLDKPGRS